MDIKLLLIGLASLSFGIVMMFRNKFYKYKSIDMLFVAKLRVFLAAALMAMMGIMIVASELNKLKWI